LNLSDRSFSSFFGWPLFGAAFLAAILLFFHFFILVPLQANLESKEASWQSERPKISQLTRLKTAQEDLLQFWETLPAETTFPQLISFISESAGAHQLSIPAISYQPDKVEIPGMVRVLISFSVKGPYQEIRNLIYTLEQSRYFLIIENLVLASSAKEGEIIQLQLRIAAYLRNKDSNDPAGGKTPSRSGRAIKAESSPEAPLL
jgi:Tfp pilus assembly protein PilO